MQTISDILKTKKIEVRTAKKKVNTVWEEAKIFGEYVGISTPFVLKLFKVYGKGKVLGLQSWLKDIPNLDQSKFPGLVIWKLKGGKYK